LVGINVLVPKGSVLLAALVAERIHFATVRHFSACELLRIKRCVAEARAADSFAAQRAELIRGSSIAQQQLCARSLTFLCSSSRKAWAGD
jgi:hypothetical protein